ncbi:hypothetical protein GGR56DRAFT_494881 [Xylariaceae sp. FL0804]|nr:hypothetical protein GGR56DRAFT_494881 [Xylariaceae sp. FL0804]
MHPNCRARRCSRPWPGTWPCCSTAPTSRTCVGEEHAGQPVPANTTAPVWPFPRFCHYLYRRSIVATSKIQHKRIANFENSEQTYEDRNYRLVCCDWYMGRSLVEAAQHRPESKKELKKLGQLVGKLLRTLARTDDLVEPIFTKNRSADRRNSTSMARKTTQRRAPWGPVPSAVRRFLEMVTKVTSALHSRGLYRRVRFGSPGRRRLWPGGPSRPHEATLASSSLRWTAPRSSSVPTPWRATNVTYASPRATRPRSSRPPRP